MRKALVKSLLATAGAFTAAVVVTTIMDNMPSAHEAVTHSDRARTKCHASAKKIEMATQGGMIGRLPVGSPPESDQQTAMPFLRDGPQRV